MFRKIIAVCIAVFAPALCAFADGEVGMPNPWTDTDAEGVMQAIGVEFGVPEGAEDVAYSVCEAEGLAQMRFTWDGMEYTARIKPAGEFEDISGMWYDPWDNEDPCLVSWCEGVTRRVTDEGITYDLCLWFDVVPGIMYSVSTQGEDLDGFDIIAAAEQVFLPMQGDADGGE